MTNAAASFVSIVYVSIIDLRQIAMKTLLCLVDFWSSPYLTAWETVNTPHYLSFLHTAFSDKCNLQLSIKLPPKTCNITFVITDSKHMVADEAFSCLSWWVDSIVWVDPYWMSHVSAVKSHVAQANKWWCSVKNVVHHIGNSCKYRFINDERFSSNHVKHILESLTFGILYPLIYCW